MRAVYRRSEAGITLIEVVAAMVILAIIAITIAQAVVVNRTMTLRNFRQDDCRLQVAEIMRNFEQYRDSVKGRQFIPQGSHRTAPPGSAAIPFPSPTPLPGLSPNDRWPTTSAFEIMTAASVPVVRSAHLSYNAMAYITAIYNSDIQHCAQPTGIKYANEPNPPNPDDLVFKNVKLDNDTESEVNVKISVYDIDSGEVVACPNPPIIVRPRGKETIAEGAMDSGSHFRMASNNYAKYGFEVTVAAAVTSGDFGNCSITKRFDFAPDVDAPPSPVASVVFNNTIPQGNCGGSLPYNDNEIRFEISPGPGSPDGVQLLCRDVSEQLVSGCRVGGTWTAPATVYNGAWRPCDVAQVCGITAVSGTSSVALMGDTPVLTVPFPDLPEKCNARLEVVAVDIAGNVSNSTTASAVVTAPNGVGCGCASPP